MVTKKKRLTNITHHVGDSVRSKIRFGSVVVKKDRNFVFAVNTDSNRRCHQRLLSSLTGVMVFSNSEHKKKNTAKLDIGYWTNAIGKKIKIRDKFPIGINGRFLKEDATSILLCGCFDMIPFKLVQRRNKKMSIAAKL